MKNTQMNIIAGIFALSATTAPAALVGLWEFNNSGDLGEATTGSDLTLDTATYGGGAITSAIGVTGGDGAASVPVDSFLRVTNSIGVNGGGTTRTNEYSIVMDIRIPTLASWTSLAETDNGATGDGDYFYSASRGLGVSSEGYVDDSDPPSTITAGTWHRLTISIDNGAVRKTYVDGVDASTIQGAHGAGALDGRWALGSTFDLFSDNGGNEEATTLISNLALYDTALDSTEVTNLGVVGTAIAVPEPSSTALLGLGGLSLIFRRRK